MSISNYHYLLKYIIIGDPCVGKSNILLQYTQQKFTPEHEITIGVEFGAKNISLNDDKIYRIQIWDTAGQETFKSITRSYFKNCACAFLVYDITQIESFNNISTWIEESRINTPKTALLVLVGNKKDLEKSRKVSYKEGQDFAVKNKMLFFECSAKTGFNIDQVFYESLKYIAEKIDENYYDLKSETNGIKKGIGGDDEVHRASHILSYNTSSKKNKKKCSC